MIGFFLRNGAELTGLRRANRSIQTRNRCNKFLKRCCVLALKIDACDCQNTRYFVQVIPQSEHQRFLDSRFGVCWAVEALSYLNKNQLHFFQNESRVDPGAGRGFYGSLLPKLIQVIVQFLSHGQKCSWGFFGYHLRHVTALVEMDCHLPRPHNASLGPGAASFPTLQPSG